jgi:Pyruvate/2-oxoacid:ferredoxin oxidoreductase delta subunit
MDQLECSICHSVCDKISIELIEWFAIKGNLCCGYCLEDALEESKKGIHKPWYGYRGINETGSTGK